ncbi:hypothetical protein B7R25_07850 [Subtercola boreus]|uniref:Uncharacterized protein n=1 Tax=Subtercola boreus TaxID=120213 RepID=A0A3E0WBN6_9MICO|nr:hypothetical protein B7R24_07780 [Subtercola boreus]RFA21655.1 hypothetical protein B7R23_07725 [Subtercola boreus]RFA27625.1 hypothetical protein B7R25_07850 [Subtercola boreus]
MPGEVSMEWLHSLRLRSFTTVSALPFGDVESPVTHTHLTSAAADVLVQQASRISTSPMFVDRAGGSLARSRRGFTLALMITATRSTGAPVTCHDCHTCRVAVQPRL